ncbi:hypothetical protein [Phascolarctobacterium faecium]|nr:hypothetical protein [Phascolarctobacterium faecium]
MFCQRSNQRESSTVAHLQIIEQEISASSLCKAGACPQYQH